MGLLDHPTKHVLMFVSIAALSSLFTFLNARRLKEKKRLESLACLRSPLDYEKHALEYGTPIACLYFGYVSGNGESLKACRESLEKVRFYPRSMKGVREF
jgi:hypothetical protein